MGCGVALVVGAFEYASEDVDGRVLHQPYRVPDSVRGAEESRRDGTAVEQLASAGGRADRVEGRWVPREVGLGATAGAVLAGRPVFRLIAEAQQVRHDD